MTPLEINLSNILRVEAVERRSVHVAWLDLTFKDALGDTVLEMSVMGPGGERPSITTPSGGKLL